ncbi:C2 domain-containing protein [Patellaria atrata CBS 101060]|uniref:C2 domain-containing protein n=1 Tax=Patellaria atrata CBS 101060 TaxID=1346257 RepID=A0A9P4SB18_9PEZI|nr:C2 domain-containing protein [Patellaria atrata CBS 101060]
MSTRSLGKGRRVNAIQQDERLQRKASSNRKRVVSSQDAYLWALRVAFLSYLLQPRARRVQHIPAPAKPIQRSTTSMNDLMKDFSLIRDSKSTKFPHGFMGELDKRITGVLIGKEKMPEYSDALVKRTFAVFLNEFKETKFRKSMEKDRRVEDLLLIFFSNATKELQKGKAHDDDSWKLMVDRHVALFIRLVSSTLKDHGWVTDRPELSHRLQTMEKKLLVHDQDLAADSQRNGGAGGSTIEVEVPRSYEIKDMPLALVVSRIFNVSYSQVQSDVNAYKSVWTEKTALQDLKAYQTNLSLNTGKTLNNEDFDTEEAFESWKKTEIPDLSQMMLAIMQSNPELAKSTSGGINLPQFKPSGPTSDSGYSSYSDNSRKLSEQSEAGSYVIDQPVDMSGLSLNHKSEEQDAPYTFIPPDPRSYYRAVLKEALMYDLKDQDLQPSEATADVPPIKLLSKESAELLNEVAVRWRVPQFSRMVLFLDVIREKYERREIELETLDAAFNYIKEPPVDGKKGSRTSVQISLFDRTKWTIADYALNQNILSTLHDALLRDLFELMLLVYDSKPPPIGPVMYILTEHVYDDPLFSKAPEDLDAFTEELRDALRHRAREVYQEHLAKVLPSDSEQWEFFHVIELGKAVVKLCERIQKRYRKNPEIMGVSPLSVLVEEMLPAYAADARDLVARIMDLAQSRGEEVPIQDGFDLYRELVEIRRVHADALPDQKFGFHIEEQLQAFVWRWIASTDANLIGWIENAVKQDDFRVRTEHPNNIPTDDERHSVSAIDIFRSFNQSIEQIVQLNWDDDVQYAKFMTALSKSIGAGVARYCELIEQRFTKEMDRVTPEQEAAARQTRQEKWMQLAKETWSNKDKIEPFQFLPESFVKLNNIEYVMLQLDKLEKEINVDACADVLKKNEPPVAHRQRKADNYVFTIKIIEAEDLKACDINGLSDPYVVLGDEYQKRLAKTRVIYGNLNPRWDETIDITTQGPLNIIATIWDWDTLGDHDCVGRTSLKLDPSHFRDFMPREYWLDLDTQGRLLLRVSMEGERDDIQFYFGKAFRTLKRTERDMTRKITDKLSAYIHHCLSRRALKAILSKGISISSVSSYFQRNRPQSVVQGPTQLDVANALKPLFNYFDDNFAIMKQTLTDSAMVMVMTRLWKEVLVTIESLLIPPLSDKPSQQRPLTQHELDIVFKWLQMLFEFFNAIDEDTGFANGVPTEVLKSPKFFELQTLNFFYNESTEDLIRTSESMAAATAARHHSRLAAPGNPHGMGFGGAAGLMGLPTRKHKTVMLSRNLGTMRKAKEDKRKEAQADPNDDVILRILRMRPEAERYLKDRSRQKERLAAAAAAEMIVRQSLNAGGGRMAGTLR